VTDNSLALISVRNSSGTIDYLLRSIDVVITLEGDWSPLRIVLYAGLLRIVLHGGEDWNFFLLNYNFKN
jgi:hypothetical protein